MVFNNISVISNFSFFTICVQQFSIIFIFLVLSNFISCNKFNKMDTIHQILVFPETTYSCFL